MSGERAGRGPAPDAEPADRSPVAAGRHAAGDVLGARYELIELLGTGAMGEVWKARHLLLQGLRAVKLIRPTTASDPEFRSRFLREGQTMMRVRHPAVVEVTDLDQTRDRGELYLVMEYLEGRTLRQAVADPAAPLGRDLRDAVRIFHEIALGMQCVHAEGVVHKDLKSDNVILVRDESGLERPKVIDFGVAKRAGAGEAAQGESSAGDRGASAEAAGTTLAGTLAYMSPEQFLGESSSPRSDMYAFGVMAFECLCRGEMPVSLTTVAEYFAHHREGRTACSLRERRPDLDRRLVEIFDRCLERDPEARPASFREVASDLRRWLEAPERTRRRRRAATGVGVAAGSIALAIWAIFFAGRTPSLGQLSVAVGAETVPVQRDRRVHLGADALAGVRLSAALSGSPGRPVLEVDGRPRETVFEPGNGTLAAAVDLSDVTDGVHEISLRASEDGARTTALVEADRRPPRIASLRLEGAPGTYSRAAAPRVLVEVAEPRTRIQRVVAVDRDGDEITAQPDPRDDRSWVVVVSMDADGEEDLVVLVADLAGNESRERFAFVRDTREPEIIVADLLGGTGVVQVRESLGAKILVTISEASVVTARFGEGIATDRELEAAGRTEFPLPAIPVNGLPVTLRLTDRAGNASTIDFTVRQTADEVALTDADGAASGVFGEGADVRLVVRSAYPFSVSPRLSATRTRDASGESVDGGERHALDPVVGELRDAGRTCDAVLPAGALPPGTWVITPEVASSSLVRPFELTLDDGPPTVESVRVLDPEGRPQNDSGFVESEDVVVEVVVADQSLARLELEDAPPDVPPGPGRRTYRFRRRCEREGNLTWVLAMVDAVGHAAERKIPVRADWTVPRLELDEPTEAGSYDDYDSIRFVGRCSEAPVRLQLRGPAGDAAPPHRIEELAFTASFRLPAGDPLAVEVVATDDAGHVSRPLLLRLRVAHRPSELPEQITWTKGVPSLMRRVDAGDVVLRGRVESVDRIYLDRTEVTNAQYRAFLAATADSAGHGPWCPANEPKDWDHTPTRKSWDDPRRSADGLPIVGVAWWDASAFAHWSGRRLPTDAEWVRAAVRARSGRDAETRIYPPFRPGEWEDGVLATWEVTQGRGPVPADSGRDVSPAGCLHMGGNVSEWTDVSDDSDESAGVRGGNWFLSSAAAGVGDLPPKLYERGLRSDTIGFRCAVDARGPGR